MPLNRLYTAPGRAVGVGAEANPRSLCNFPRQANGAEMLRWAGALATERGVSVVIPVRDAVMAGGPADAVDAIVAGT